MLSQKFEYVLKQLMVNVVEINQEYVNASLHDKYFLANKLRDYTDIINVMIYDICRIIDHSSRDHNLVDGALMNNIHNRLTNSHKTELDTYMLNNLKSLDYITDTSKEILNKILDIYFNDDFDKSKENHILITKVYIMKLLIPLYYENISKNDSTSLDFFNKLNTLFEANLQYNPNHNCVFTNYIENCKNINNVIKFLEENIKIVNDNKKLNKKSL